MKENYKEDFSVPQEFENFLDILRKKDTLTKRDFVDLSLLAIKLVDSHWKMRQRIAYHTFAVWAHIFLENNVNLKNDMQLDEIGGKFGELELPDYHAAGSEQDVRKAWDDLGLLVGEADAQYSNNTTQPK